VATSRSPLPINMTSGPDSTDEKIFIISEFALQATVQVDMHRVPKDFLSSGSHYGWTDSGPWNQCHLTGMRNLDRVVPLQLTGIQQTLNGGPIMGTRYREVELEFEGRSAFGSGMSREGAAYSTPQTTDPRKIDTIDVEKAVEEAADVVVATIPAGLPGRDYLVQVAREAALQGAKLALKALAEG